MGGKPTRSKRGSKLLGEELRRLRGRRHLSDIAALSRARHLTQRIRPISVPTLSQIENGITMPTLESLYTLSVIYQVSATRLLNVIAEERLTADGNLPATLEETRQRLETELLAARWDEALALAIHGERLAPTDADRALWHSYRGVAMHKMGMRHDAIILLTECVEGPDLRPEQRFVVHKHLADVLAEAGFLQSAASQARRASDCAPRNLELRLRVNLMQTHVMLLLRDNVTRRAAQTCRDALGLIAEARQLMQVEPHPRLQLDLLEAIAWEQIGNLAVASRSYVAIAKRATVGGFDQVAMIAWANLGMLRRSQGRFVDAARLLERAETLAVFLKQYDAAFDIYFELFLVEQERGNAARQRFYLKRCERYWPLLQSRTPNVVRFERLAAATVVR